MAFTKTETRRITFLSLLSSASNVKFEDAYSQAKTWLEDMEEDGFFTEEVSNPSSSRPSGGSARPASPSRSGNPGRGPSVPRGGGYSGGMRDPDGPPSDKQVQTVLKNTSDYTRDELFEMTKQEVSNLIDDLFSR